MHRIVHVSHKARKHSLDLILLSLQVINDLSLAFTDDQIHENFVLLSEPIATPNNLVILLKRVTRKNNYVMTLLEV